MKVVNLLLAVIFLLFAFVQINDPDPVLWILIYGVMAVLCILAAFKVFVKPVYWVLVIAFIVYMIILWPGVREWLSQPELSVLFDDGLKMQHPYIEESREFLGLFICVAVLSVYALRPVQLKNVN
jgi:hypothetical protein